MKSISFKVIAFFLLITNLQLSSQDYYPFPDSNAIWNVIGDNMFSGDEFRYRFGLSDDTILNTIPYSKLYDLFDTNLIHQESEYIAGIRNEEKKVFIKLPDFQETLLYDFSLTIGDTIWYEIGGSPGFFYWSQTHWKTVVSIDSILVENGEYRKKWHLESEGFSSDIWVEGIGSINRFGVINPIITEVIPNGDTYNFVCFKQNNQVIYLDNPYCDACFCQLYTPVEKTKIKRDRIIVFPNPAKDWIKLQFNVPDRFINKLIIYNAMGIEVQEIIIDDFAEIEIALDNYQRGLYLISIINNNNEAIGITRFVVQ